MQIAIDTSTDIASLALLEGSEILAELTWLCKRNHTVELYTRLEFLLARSGIDVKAIDCVFIARGPGSFNGLRVGVSAAKGLAFSLGIPIIGVSTLEATAYQHAETGLPVCAIQNAGREEIAVAIYQNSPRKGWRQLAPEHLTKLKLLPSEIGEKTIFCGEIGPAVAVEIKKIFKANAIVPGPAARLRRAAYAAELCQKRLTEGTFDNVSTLQPLYLRRPPITERKKA